MTWVLFDFGGVVSLPPSAADTDALAARAGLTPAALRAGYFRRRQDYDLGVLDDRGYWEDLRGDAGPRYSDADIAELARLDLQAWLHLNPGTLALLAELDRGGHRLALLSNAQEALAAVLPGQPVARFFAHLMFSCELAAAKPDPRCYRLALDRLGACPQEVIFVDDREDNVASAAALGIRAVRFTAAAAAREQVCGLLATRA